MPPADDPGPSDAKQDVTNGMTTFTDASSKNDVGVMQQNPNPQVESHHKSDNKGPHGPEELSLPPSSTSTVAHESGVTKRYRANSHRASWGRPSPLLKSQRSSLCEPEEPDPRARQGPTHHGASQLRRLVGEVQSWIDHERDHLDGGHGDLPQKFDFRLSLERLQQILHKSLHLDEHQPGAKSALAEALAQVADAAPGGHPRTKRSSLSLRKLGRAPTCPSDTETEADRHPPAVDAVLDNSKTLSYCTPSSTDLTRRYTNAGAWHTFKTEIVRLSHTLKLKGWRRVPLERSDDIEVQRLSGALTNAVYVVAPPKDLPDLTSSEIPIPRPPPSKLLLRIYGPQVEHLIDRESELAILRRLARKNIGPKLLGTFTNGRFEEYLNAKTLTPNDIRDPVLSRQIAKRMRELHVGIKLLPEEREAGPFVWQNWDKWKERCEEVIEWLDNQIRSQETQTDASKLKRVHSWRHRGMVCGVEWKVFRHAVRTYRTWLEGQYGGQRQVLDSLVFAHNDTQYGNLLRLMPDDKESPLLQPANEHRRLVVIDFEYSSANTPGLEFANHFTEWCYNYHSDEPHACVTDAYPSTEEQKRFVRAYVNHVPHFQTRTPGATPVLGATSSPLLVDTPSPFMRPQLRGSVSSFMLDSRAPPGSGNAQQLSSSSSSQNLGNYFQYHTYEEEEKARQELEDREVDRLLRETRLWRVANSAQWVAWGIVQAKVPGMEADLQARKAAKETDETGGNADSTVCQSDASQPQLFHDTATEPNVEKEEEQEGKDEDDEDEFDYLAYAQERAMFFWGDILALGIMREDEIPPELVAKAKRVNR